MDESLICRSSSGGPTGWSGRCRRRAPIEPRWKQRARRTPPRTRSSRPVCGRSQCTVGGSTRAACRRAPVAGTGRYEWGCDRGVVMHGRRDRPRADGSADRQEPDRPRVRRDRLPPARLTGARRGRRHVAGSVADVAERRRAAVDRARCGGGRRRGVRPSGDADDAGARHRAHRDEHRRRGLQGRLRDAVVAGGGDLLDAPISGTPGWSPPAWLRRSPPATRPASKRCRPCWTPSPARGCTPARSAPAPT